MTDSQLEKLLKSAPAPQRSTDYWEEFPTRITARHGKEPEATHLCKSQNDEHRPALGTFLLGEGHGEHSPKRISRINTSNLPETSGSLASPKGVEGWGEEAISSIFPHQLHAYALRLFRTFTILPPRLIWPTAIATVCLILGFTLGLWHKPAQKIDYAVLQNESTVREILTMFPNRVRAILQTEQGLQLVLSDKPDVPTSTPLWIQVGEGKQGQAAVTFSGQEIQIGGEKMTVLSDAQGGVILMAKHLIWSSTAPNQGPKNIKIQAKSL